MFFTHSIFFLSCPFTLRFYLYDQLNQLVQYMVKISSFPLFYYFHDNLSIFAESNTLLLFTLNIQDMHHFRVKPHLADFQVDNFYYVFTVSVHYSKMRYTQYCNVLCLLFRLKARFVNKFLIFRKTTVFAYPIRRFISNSVVKFYVINHSRYLYSLSFSVFSVTHPDFDC